MKRSNTRASLQVDPFGKKTISFSTKLQQSMTMTRSMMLPLNEDAKKIFKDELI